MNSAKQGLRRYWLRGVLAFVLSVALVAQSPMTTYVYAQSASQSQLQQLKEKATSEIERRVESYQKTIDGLKEGFKADKDKNGSAGREDCASEEDMTSFASDGSSLSFALKVPCGLKDQAKEYLEKLKESLEQLKEKVEDASSMSEMDSLGQNIDSQYDLGQLTQVQGSVTQAIESITGTLSKMKEAYKGLQEQVKYVRECFGSAQAETESAQTDDSESKNPECDKLGGNVEDQFAQAQEQLLSMETVMSTVQTVIASSVMLLTTLVSQFTNLTGGLGGGDSLSNIGNLGNMTSAADLEKLTSSFSSGGIPGGSGGVGDIGGMMGSFGSILSQIEIATSQMSEIFSALNTLANNEYVASALDSLGLGGVTGVLDQVASSSGSSGSSGIDSALSGLGGDTGNLGGMGGLSSLGDWSSLLAGATTKQIGRKGDFTGSRDAHKRFVEGGRQGQCAVDYSHVSSSEQAAKIILDLCAKQLPKVEELLSSRYNAGAVQIVYIPNSYTSDGLTSGRSCTPSYNKRVTAFSLIESGRVYMCADHFSARDAGQVVHEMAKLTQTYSKSANTGVEAPSWFVEGVAAYARTETGFDNPDIRYSTGNTYGCNNTTYLSGFRCGNALFHYIEREHSKSDLVKQAHVGAQKKGYTDALLTKGTNKTLKQLYNDCLAAECKGGKRL